MVVEFDSDDLFTRFPPRPPVAPSAAPPDPPFTETDALLFDFADPPLAELPPEFPLPNLRPPPPLAPAEEKQKPPVQPGLLEEIEKGKKLKPTTTEPELPARLVEYKKERDQAAKIGPKALALFKANYADLEDEYQDYLESLLTKQGK